MSANIFLLAGILGVMGAGRAVAPSHTRLGLGFQLAFLIRFQLLLLLSPVIIFVLSYAVPGVFGNIIELGENGDPTWEAFTVALAGFGSAWFCLALTITVLDHAVQRFAVPDFKVPRWFWDWSPALFALPPVILMVRVCSASARTVLANLVGLAAGLLVALVIALMVDALVHFLDPLNAPSHRRFIFSSESRLYPRRLSNWFRSQDPLSHVPGWMFGWLEKLGPGYCKDGRPYPDLIATTLMLLFTLILYSWTFYRGGWYLTHDSADPGIPTLAYLEFLMLSFMLVLTGAAYFLDRFRIPVIGAVVVYTLVCSLVTDTDHYWFASMPVPAASSPATPAAYTDGVNGWLNHYKQPGEAAKILRDRGEPVVVVVCASGGGIQASAWVARVLSGLQEQLKDSGAAFSRSVRLISSTS